MQNLKIKLRSETGASITFALLLFLVCSVVSIVVVVAGSAAAGRMSQRAETDQRYYAVTSAAELLCDDFKGKTVVVEYTKAVSTGFNEDTPIRVIEIDGEKQIVENKGVLEAVSKRLVSKIASGASDSATADAVLTLVAAKSGGSGSGGGDGGGTGLTSNAETAPAFSLGCTINAYVKKDGRVVFEVRNTASGNTPVYTLQVVLNANISPSSFQYTDGDTLMEKVTTTLVWSLNSIKKGSVTPLSSAITG